MSASLKNTYAAAPNAQRGRPVHLGGDLKNKKVFLYCCGNSVFIRQLDNPLLVEQYQEHQAAPTVARLAPSGFYCASGDASGKVRIWDMTQKEHILKIELPIAGGPILDLAWSEDSKRVVAVGEGREVFGRVFMFDSGSSVGEVSSHTKFLLTCDMKPTRPYRMVTAGEDFAVNFYEGPPFKVKRALADAHDRFVNCVRFAPNGERLATASLDKKVLLWDAKEGTPACKLDDKDQHQGGVYSVAWSGDSKQLLTASADKTCKLWDADSGRCLQTFHFSDNPQTEHQQLGCLWQGDYLLSVSLAGHISYLDPANPARPKRVVHGHVNAITAAAFDAAAGAIYSASHDAVVIRWDAATGQTTLVGGQGHTNAVQRVRIAGGRLLSIGKDDTVRFTPLAAQPAYTADVVKLDHQPVDLAVSASDASLAVVATLDGVVAVRNQRVCSKQSIASTPLSIALAPNNATVYVGCQDGGIYVFKLAGDQLQAGQKLTGHNGEVSALAISPDGKHLLSADSVRNIYVWSTADHQIAVRGWQYHTARILTAEFSPDNDHVATAGVDGQIIVWSVKSPNSRIQIARAHFQGVSVVSWINPTTLLSGGQDCCIKTWDVKF